MYHFIYVTKNKAAPIKNELIKLIKDVQNEVCNHFTFCFGFVGSSSRNMITYDEKENKGFDFDVDIQPNDPEKKYEPKKIRTIIYNAFNKCARKYGYSLIENSTRVITIKVQDPYHCKTKYSCDIAIINTYYDEQQYKQKEYIRYNKIQNTYTWEYSGSDYHLEKKIKWLKHNSYWHELRDYYLYKKNNNNDPNKHSRSLFAESVNEMYSRYHNI